MILVSVKQKKLYLEDNGGKMRYRYYQKQQRFKGGCVSTLIFSVVAFGFAIAISLYIGIFVIAIYLIYLLILLLIKCIKLVVQCCKTYKVQKMERIYKEEREQVERLFLDAKIRNAELKKQDDQDNFEQYLSIQNWGSKEK